MIINKINYFIKNIYRTVAIPGPGGCHLLYITPHSSSTPSGWRPGLSGWSLGSRPGLRVLLIGIEGWVEDYNDNRVSSMNIYHLAEQLNNNFAMQYLITNTS